MLTPAQPVWSIIFLAASGVVTSPLPMTGIRCTASTTARTPTRLTVPPKPCSRAAMHENRGHAHVFERAGQGGRGDVPIVPAETHLRRDRHFHCVHHAFH